MPNNWQAIGLEDGGLAALWRNPATGELYVQSFDNDGSALTEVTAIQTGSHTTSQTGTFPIDLDQQADGTLIVTWETDTPDTIYTQVIDIADEFVF